MSGQATGWVLRHGPKDRAQRLVLLAIADAANRDGEHAFPGMKAISEASLYSEGHCRRAIAKMVEEGWLEVTANADGGRGLAAEYRVVMDGKGAHDARLSDENPRIDEPKGAHFERETRASSDSSLFTPTDTTVKNNASAVASDADPLAALEARDLCEELSSYVAAFRGDASARPQVTKRWLDDMELLLRCGPLHRDKPGPLVAAKVRLAMRATFEALAEPQGARGFCWAAQIRSPGALRDHWDQLGIAYREQRRLGTRAGVISEGDESEVWRHTK